MRKLGTAAGDPAAGPMGAEVDEDLANLLMAWYWTGSTLRRRGV